MQKHVNPPETEDLARMGVPRAEFIAMVAGLMALNALAIDILLPGFPFMAADLSVDGNAIQYVLLSYVLGFGIAQLFFGPLSDRFGRRAPLFFGLAGYIVCAIAGVFAPDFQTLLLFRFLQGVSAASTRVIALAVVRDTHAGRMMASTMSMVMMVFMVVPIVAPFVGQMIILFVSWHFIFAFMATLAVVMMVWTWFRLSETLPEAKRRPLTLRSIAGGFGLVLSNRISAFYALATACFFGSMFSFLNTAQPILVDIYGTGAWFPIVFSSIAVLMAVSSFLNSRLVGRFGMRRLSHGALIAHLVATTTASAIFFAGPAKLWVFMLCMGIIMPLFGLIGANFNSIAMEPLGKVAGTASSVLGFTQTVGGGVIGAVIGQAFDGTVFPLLAGTASVSFASLMLVLVAEKGQLFTNPNADARAH